MRTVAGVTLTVAAALALLSCGGSPGAAAKPPQPETHTIAIADMRFQPETLTVNPCDSIVWVNQDMFPHTATAERGFDSKGIDAGKSWQHTAGASGTFPYVCTYHPTMKGTLQVR